MKIMPSTSPMPATVRRCDGDEDGEEHFPDSTGVASTDSEGDLLRRLDDMRLSVNTMFSAALHDVLSAGRLKERYSEEHRRVLARTAKFIESFSTSQESEAA